MKIRPIPLLVLVAVMTACGSVSIEGRVVQPGGATAAELHGSREPSPTSTPDWGATAAVEEAVRLTLTAAVPTATRTSASRPTLTAEPTTPIQPTATPTTTETPPPTATVARPVSTATPPPAFTNADAIAGPWTGTLDNTAVRIDLFIQTGCTVGSTCGNASAPLCSVSVELVTIDGDMFVFLERLLTGDPGFCVTGGYEYLRLRSDGSLAYTFRYTGPSGETMGSTATLRRP